jgi:hypothetical protein
VLQIRFRWDPDPDVWGRIRILALINNPILTVLVCVKAQKKTQESLLFNFLIHEETFKSIFWSKSFRKKLAKNLLRSESGSGSGQESSGSATLIEVRLSMRMLNFRFKTTAAVVRK